MEHALEEFFSQVHWSLLAVVIVAGLAAVGKSADWLVEEAVALSRRSGIPTVVIGATIVSLGTTSPEAAVSVFAALQGSPGLALGNAVGSIICDTGLILGLACLINPLRLDRTIVNRQGWIQFGAGILLVLASFPWTAPEQTFTAGGNLPRWMGMLFLVGLAVYMWQSVRWARQEQHISPEVEAIRERAPTAVVLLKLLGALALLVVSAQVLIPAVKEAALRMDVPESIIAATIVAFGTSLPELVTAVTAARKGHGELAIGNVVGADILNVLFVAGAAAAATPGGLDAGGHFFLVLFPVMMFVLSVFRIGIHFSGGWMKRPFGYALLAAYGVYLVASYLVPDAMPVH